MSYFSMSREPQLIAPPVIAVIALFYNGHTVRPIWSRQRKGKQQPLFNNKSKPVPHHGALACGSLKEVNGTKRRHCSREDPLA